MDERHKTGRGALLIGLLLLAALPAAVAVNDPGHDSLYVLLTGDSNIIGNLNISNRLNASNLRFATLLYGDYLDIRANTSIYTPSSRPAIQADANDLYLDSLANVYLATRAGTTGRVQVGPTTGSGITLNVSGTILQQNVRVCLANGSNCPGGNNTGNVSSVTAGNGLANSGTAADPVLDVTAGDGIAISADQVIINNASVCRTSGVGCPAGATAEGNVSGSGIASRIPVWTNGSYLNSSVMSQRLGSTNTLDVNASVNLSHGGASVYLESGSGSRIAFGQNGDYSYLSVGAYNGINNIDTKGRDLAFYSDSAPSAMRLVASTGNLGIGTTAPAQSLDVNGSVNVSGTSGNLNIQNGVLQLAGTTRISNAGVGSFATGTTVNALGICLADGTNCIVSNSNAGGGWLNSSGSGNISLANVNANISANTLFIDNTNGRVGVGTRNPNGTFTVQGTDGESYVMWVLGGVGFAGVGVQPGRAGGSVSIETGAGGLGISNFAGNGGDLNLSSGMGGSSGASLVGAGGTVTIRTGGGGVSLSGASAGGTAGNLQIITGVGGNSTTSNGGSGGNVSILLGNGGNNSDGGTIAGPGGSFLVQAGDGGNNDKGTGGDGGNIYLQPGLGAGAGTSNGSVIIPNGNLGVLGGGAYVNSSSSDGSLHIQNTSGSSHLFVNGSSGFVSIGSATSAASLFVDAPADSLEEVLQVSGDNFVGSGGSTVGIRLSQLMITNVTNTFGLSAYVTFGPYKTNASLGITDLQSYRFGGLMSSAASSDNTTNMTITRYTHIWARPDISNTFNGTISNLRVIEILSPSWGSGGGNGTITTLAGLHIRDMTSVNGTTYGIAVAGTDDMNYFAGNLTVGGTTTRARLTVDDNSYDAGTPLLAVGDDTYFTDIDATSFLSLRSVTDPTVANLQLGSNGGNLTGYVGKIGVNTATPTHTLTVAGDTNTTGTLYIGQAEVRNGFSYVNNTIADVSTSSNTVYTRLNLSLNLSANSQYVIDCNIISDAAATSTGVVLGINLTGSPTTVRATYTSAGFVAAGVTGIETFSGTGTTTNLFADTNSFTTPEVSRVAGYVVTGSSTVGWHVDVRSEVGSSAVNVRAGSFCRSTKVA